MIHHLTVDSLFALASKGETSEAASRAASHLALCRECRRLLDQLPDEVQPLVRQKLANPDPRQRCSVLEYRKVVHRVVDGCREEELRAERAHEAAEGLFAELERYPLAQRRIVVANLQRFQCWALAELLLQEARRVWTGDPELAEVRAVLACDIAQGLTADGYRFLLLNDLRAEAWSFVANACRIRGHFPEAEKAFEVAESFLAEGSGEIGDLAQVLDLKVSLLREQRKFAEALKLLEQILACRRSQGDRHLVGRSLISKAKLLRDWDRVEESVPLLLEAAQLIDPRREPYLELVLKGNLIVYMLETGKAQEARPMLPVVKQLARKIGNRLDRLRAIWIEGRLLHALGQQALGEELLRSAHEGFLNVGIHYEAALVALDLAEIYLESGRMIEVRALADRATAYALMSSHTESEREILATLAGFRGAAEDRRSTRVLIDEIGRKLRSLTSRQSLADGEL